MHTHTHTLTHSHTHTLTHTHTHTLTHTHIHTYTHKHIHTQDCSISIGMPLICLQSPDEDIRVILINTYSDVARVVLCEVGAYWCIMLIVVRHFIL